MDFNLWTTLTSGQVFRWRQADSPGAFIGWIGADLVSISQQGSQLVFQGTSEAQVRNFFSLDVDLNTIAREIDVDLVIHTAMKAHWGLRVIRQEPWECLVSFILSSFNNIPRLTGMLNRLAVRFGELAETTPSGGLCTWAHQFPRPEVLAKVSERALRRFGLGFRAPYLKGAAEAVAGGAVDLEGWARLEDEALRRNLLTVPGVGEKVVECVMLFGFGRPSAFPVDVWIGRAMRAWYFKGRRNVTDQRIREFSHQHFGPYCGWAQQFLYCQARLAGKGALVD